MQMITVNLNLSRGSCRINQPLYLGETVTLSFSEAGAYSLILTEPFADSPKDGIVVWAQSTATGELSLNRKALHSAFKKAEAMQPNMTISAKCFVISEDEQTVADGEVAIEYSPKAFVIDYEDYPLAKEILSQATSAKELAINAKDSAISAKSAAESAKLKAEKARDEAISARSETQEAKTRAEEAAKTSSMAREDAIRAKDAAQNAKDDAEENASKIEAALGKMIANVKKVAGGVEVLLWNGQGDKPVPVFIPHGIDGVTGYVKCDEDGKYYCLKCKEVDGEKVLALEQVGVDNVATEKIYVRSVNGTKGDEAGNVTIPLNFLPLSGGTLTGPIEMFPITGVLRKANDTGRMFIEGGTSASIGAYLALNSNGYQDETGPDSKGSFSLFAKSAVGSSGLVGKPNGSLSWNDKNIVRSVNGTNADAAGNIVLLLNFLPLSGGTMTGALRLSNNGYIAQSENNKSFDIYGGTGWNYGAFLRLHGKDSTSQGCVDLSAQDGTNRKQLLLTPNGELIWDGKHIVRSINGVEAGEDGDVYAPYIECLDSSYCYEEAQGPLLAIDNSAGGGFIMQSGVVEPVDASDGATITFDKPFRDTNYVVVCQYIRNSATNSGVAVKSKSTTGFTIDTNSGVDVMWFAFGYPKD